METTIRALGAPGDLGWVVQAHGEDYADEFGWDTTFEALVARIVADYADADHDRAGAWIAEAGGQRAGCVFCIPYDDATAQLRILLVRPAARGLGLGRALVDTCVDFARGRRYTTVRLWTNDVLGAARRIYLDCGFQLVDEVPHHSFGVDLVGQTYVLPLTP
jgi:GNAT superfamily N-acetyltransferase